MSEKFNQGEKVRLIKPIKMGKDRNLDTVNKGTEGVIDNITSDYALINISNHGFFIIGLEYISEFFEKVEEVYSLTPNDIDKIMDKCQLNVMTVWDKCTIVACKLPNGFIITESSACVDPKNYDEHIGLEICLNKIRDKVWELEGYRLQQIMYDAATKDTQDLKLLKTCNCNEDCDLCNSENNLCPYHCNDICEECERHKGE